MKNRKLWLGLILAVLLGGLAWAYITGRIGPDPGRLYVYYPQSTGFYVELDAKKGLGKRLINFVRQRAEVGDDAPMPPGADRDSFQAALIREFDAVLEPYFSLGVWPDPSQPQNLDVGEILLALPLRDDLTTAELLVRLDLKKSQFQKARHADVEYLIQPETQTSFTVLDGNLLLANSPQALLKVLTLQKEEQPNIYDNLLNRKYISRLSKRRDGTFILNNTAYTGRSPADDTSTRAGQLRRLAEVVPLTVGAVRVDSAEHIATRFLTPIVLKEIGNADLRQDLRAFYEKPAEIRAPELLAGDTSLVFQVAGLDMLFDIYKKYFMAAEERQRVTGLAGFLQLAQIDFRQDIIGLLAGGTIVSATPDQSLPTLMLENTAAKQKAIAKLTGFLEKSNLPIQQKPEQIGKVSAQTLIVPSRDDFSVTYGSTNGVFVVAPTAQFAELAKVWDNTTDSLKKSPNFRTLTRDYPGRGNLFVYLDLKRQREFLSRHADKVDKISPQGASTLSNMKRYDWIEVISALITAKADGEQGDLVEGRLDFLLTPEADASAQ